MILVRDVFRLKFGKARDAMAVWREMLQQAKRAGYGATSTSLLTDLVGSYYTIVLESTFDDLASFERGASKLTKDEQWRTSYQKFTLLAESGYREIFTIVTE